MAECQGGVLLPGGGQSQHLLELLVQKEGVGLEIGRLRLVTGFLQVRDGVVQLGILPVPRPLIGRSETPQGIDEQQRRLGRVLIGRLMAIGIATEQGEIDLVDQGLQRRQGLAGCHGLVIGIPQGAEITGHPLDASEQSSGRAGVAPLRVGRQIGLALGHGAAKGLLVAPGYVLIAVFVLRLLHREVDLRAHHHVGRALGHPGGLGLLQGGKACTGLLEAALVELPGSLQIPLPLKGSTAHFGRGGRALLLPQDQQTASQQRRALRGGHLALLEGVEKRADRGEGVGDGVAVEGVVARVVLEQRGEGRVVGGQPAAELLAQRRVLHLLRLGEAGEVEQRLAALVQRIRRQGEGEGVMLGIPQQHQQVAPGVVLVEIERIGGERAVGEPEAAPVTVTGGESGQCNQRHRQHRAVGQRCHGIAIRLWARAVRDARAGKGGSQWRAIVRKRVTNDNPF